MEDTWDLTPLFPSDQDWEKELESVRKEFPKILEWNGRVVESPATLRDVLEFEKHLNQRLEQLNQFASLRLTEDGANSESLSREARLQSLLTNLSEAFAFVVPEIQALGDKEFAAFSHSQELSEWKFPLQKLRRGKPHTLSPGEERLLALGASTVGGHHDAFSQLMNVDMRYGSITLPDGSTVEVSQSSLSSFLINKEPTVRRDAFHRFYEEISDHRHTLATLLANSVRGDVFYARARNHPSAIESALFGDDVPVTVYENLLSTVRDRLPALFRYYHLRKDLLKLPELHFYDTYVPLVPEVVTDVSWDDAVEKVLRAVAPLGAEYVSVLDHGLREGRWCDRYENKGKRSGAFSYGTYQSPPYIMMNYKRDVFSDVYTLAHEAGHSMHTWYSKNAQLYQNYHYPIFLAEVASTFNECLLTELLLKETDDPKMRAFLINRQIDDFRGTLFRQTMFAEFERDAHALEENGGALTLESFREIYRGLLDSYFGNCVTLDAELELECLRIPHFYSAFYVYKYATGLAAAVALARQVLETGDAGRYLEFLKSGGSRFPLETLERAGVDMRSTGPISSALDLFDQRVGELEELAGRW